MHTLKELKELPERKLIEEFDKRSGQEHVLMAEEYYDELMRRSNEKLNKSIKKWTIAIGVMTAIMLIATIANVIIACGC